MTGIGIPRDVAYIILQSEKLRSLDWKPLLEGMTPKDQKKLLKVLENMSEADWKMYINTRLESRIMFRYILIK